MWAISLLRFLRFLDCSLLIGLLWLANFLILTSSTCVFLLENTCTFILDSTGHLVVAWFLWSTLSLALRFAPPFLSKELLILLDQFV